ncbi:Spermidine synthase [hydrothermal vent metagenome]|uniref:Spermidine synthase n=1 Tax=hydrothermal vent metagenome TaxID=652676 RepID=A0A1W1BK99_9ZZZZ
MRENTYKELMVHVPVCTHKEPKDVLIISDDASSMIDEVAKYNTINTKTINKDLDTLRELENESFDVVISEAAIDPVSTAHINRVLKADGLVAFAPFDLENQEQSKTKLKEIGKYFKIAMPYSLLATTSKTAVLASKEYHPTADINLQRADLTDGFTVYNSDLHVGIFAMPTYIKKAYLGIIKN